MTYAAETWVLKESSFQKLLVFERKILRKIFGPTRGNQLWRIKTNNGLNKLIKHQNIVNYVKTLRLSWFGHVQRKPDFRTANKTFKWTPLTTRPKGRPKQRWEDNVIQDIRLNTEYSLWYNAQKKLPAGDLVNSRQPEHGRSSIPKASNRRTLKRF